MSSDQKEEHEDSYYLVGSAAAEILKTVQSREESRIVYSEKSRGTNITVFRLPRDLPLPGAN
jgi:hypothetical protein